MARQRTQATATDRVSTTLRGEVRKLIADANVDQLRRLGRALGNEALSGKLSQNDRMRDVLLALVNERLEAIRLAQAAEIKALRERGPWWRRLRRGEPGVGLPEPTRWAEPARLFRLAAASICAGDLGRGAELMREAGERERAHRKAVPDQVQIVRHDAPSPTEAAALAEVRAGEGCTPTVAPELVRLAARIENVGAAADAAGQLLAGKHVGAWWETEADEDEEKKPKEGLPRSRRLEEPTARAEAGRRPDREATGPAAPVAEVKVELTDPAPGQVRRRAPRR